MEPFRVKDQSDSEGLNSTGALIEINNLLASVNSPLQINPVDIESIASRFQTNTNNSQLSNGLTSLYQQYLLYCLVDKKLSEDEIKNLHQLKKIFLLTDKVVKQLTDDIVSKIYLEELSSALADGVITSDEAVFLMKLKKDLFLDTETAEKLYETASRNFLDEQVELALADERLTDDEEIELARLADNLNIDIVHDLNTKKLLEKYRLYWLIENGQLPVVMGQIPFNPDEECHYLINDVLWYEEDLKEETKPLNRFTMRRRINKMLEATVKKTGFGDLWVGNFNLIEKGTLYFSNTKIYFQGEHNGMFIEYENISGFEAFENGIKIILTSGGKHLLQFSDRVDIVCLLINRLMYN